MNNTDFNRAEFYKFIENNQILQLININAYQN